jgi:hypothetical protein
MIGKVLVGDDCIWAVQPELLPGVETVLGFDHLEAGVRKLACESPAGPLKIVNDEDLSDHVAFLPARLPDTLSGRIAFK